jgi:iron complex outermembrane receptor protein
MYNNSKVAKSIRLALMIGAASTAAISTSAFSADEGIEEIEKIEVTGSRIKRSDLEGASPVTIISAESMKIEGNFTVADALRGSSFNSFGSFSERSGSSSQSQATINLRGAGSKRTLVLLDGKRLPGSPTLGGQSANLNAIPMAAVERIEILTDGASSTYGSDAIAGVVNIIMKKNYEGLEFNIGAGSRERDSGTTSSEFSVIGGFSTDKGNITFAFDHQKRDGISDADRHFTKAKMTDFNGDGEIQAYEETDGWSIYGATVATPDWVDAQASPECDNLIAEYGEDAFQKVAADNDWGNPGATYCMFAYANASYNKASVDRNTVFVDANYEVADGVEWFGRAMFVQNSSFGRYAPPAARWDDFGADNIHNPYSGSDAEGTKGFFRWVGIGNRDGNVDDYNQDYLTGFRGDLDWNNASWEVYYHRNTADNKSVGQYYQSKGGLAHNIANDIDLGSEEGIANLKATTLQESDSTFDQFFAGIGFDLFELPGGDVAHYFGAEYQEITFSDIYDAQSAAGLVGGSAGNSSSGERDIKAVFYEAVLPVSDSLEVNIAARYDDYSDFGDNVAPKVSLRWQALDNVVVRASYSEAFRAPGLDELNSNDTFSAEDAIDYVTGGTTTKQFDTWYRSNSDLKAETSEYINFGVAWDVTDNVGIKLDYFNLSIDDVIETKTVQDLIIDEMNGVITALGADADTSEEFFYLQRSPTGKLIEAGTGYYNGIGFDIEGIDLAFNALVETEMGDFRFNMVNSFTLSYEEQTGGKIVDTASWSGQPDFKSVATISWSIDDHSIAWNANYTDSTSENEKFVALDDDGNKLANPYYDISGKLDSWLIHNLTYTYNAGDLGSIRLTVNNLTDEDPVLNSSGQYDDADLYNNYGREYRASYTISF